MNHDLEIALTLHRWWRDVGNDILLIGVLAEFVIDAVWPERPDLLPLLRGKRATRPLRNWYAHLLTARGMIVVVVGLAVFIGIGLERWQGTKADDVADQIRAEQQTRIADAEDRATHAQDAASQSNERAANALGVAAKATERAAEAEAHLAEANAHAAEANAKAEQFRVAIAELQKERADILVQQETLKRDNLNLAKALHPRRVGTVEVGKGDVLALLTGGLDKFSGTVALIQSVPDWESTRLAADIYRVLSRFGWKPQFVDERITTVSPLVIDDGLEIFTMRDIRVLNPRTKNPGTEAQKRSAQAAEILRQYLEAWHVENGHMGLRREGLKYNDATVRSTIRTF